MNSRINLVWRSEGNNSFIIGEILNNDHRYYFKYNEEEVRKAIEEGFCILEGFPRINSKYFSEEPFKLFTSWIGESHKGSELTFEMLKGFTYEQFRFEEVLGNNKRDDEGIA